MLRRAVLALAIWGSLAAVIGIVLWVLPDLTAESLLNRLGRLGYPVGGVPPFGHISRVPVLLDRAVARWDIVYGGGGDDRTMLRLTPAELQAVTGATWIDLAADPALAPAAP